MSKIAREITKKAGIAVLAATILFQSVGVKAAETVKNTENKTSVVSENNNVKETKPAEEKVTVDKEKSSEEKTEKKVVSNENEKNVQALSLADKSKTQSKPKVEAQSKVKDTKAAEVDETKLIPDAALREEIKSRLSVSKLTKDNLAKLKILYIPKEVKSLEGIENCTQLTDLQIDDEADLDVTPVGNVRSLKELFISMERSIDLNVCSKLTNLERLYVVKINNENLEGIKNCKELYRMEIRDAVNLNDISAASSLTKLRSFFVMNSKISDISPISNIKPLKSVYVVDSNVSDVTPLGNLPSIEEIIIYNDKVTDLSGLYSLLKNKPVKPRVFFDGNMIGDLSLIVDATNYIDRQIIRDQKVTLKEIATEGGNVVYKIPFDKKGRTKVEIDEKDGKYDPETNTITFYNITSDKTVKYKIEIADFENMEDEQYTGSGFIYQAEIQQPFKLGAPQKAQASTSVVSDNKQNSTPTASNTGANNKTNNLVKTNSSVKTGDVAVAGTLSLAVMSLIGVIKTRKRR